jgi:hypothetical protein
MRELDPWVAGSAVTATDIRLAMCRRHRPSVSSRSTGQRDVSPETVHHSSLHPSPPVYFIRYPRSFKIMPLQAGWPGFDSRQGLGTFLFATASRTALGPNQPPIQWVPRVLSPGVKPQERETDHSPPSSAEVNNAPLLHYVFMARCLVKHRDNFTVTLLLLLLLHKVLKRLLD